MAGTLFRRVRIFDGERRSDATTVLVRDGIVVRVGADDGVPAADDLHIVDGHGRCTLLPGLIDAHTHVVGAALEQAIRFGVTTELDMANLPSVIQAAKQAQLDPQAPAAADVRSAGCAATVPGGHGTQFFPDVPTVRAPQDAPAFVADRVAEGSDYVKIHYVDDIPRGPGGSRLPTVDPATLAAVANAAHAHGLLALAHVGTLAAALEALTAGIDGLAHAFFDAPAPDDPRRESIARFADLAAERGAFLIPTFTTIDLYAGGTGVCALADDPVLGPLLSDDDRSFVARQRAGLNPSAPVHSDSARASVRAAAAAGVPILAGTDMVFALHGAAIHRELEFLVDAGLTPAQALASATAVPARIFGLDDRGRIAPGSRADLLLVDGDPLADIRRTRAIVGVWQRGVEVSRQPAPAR